MLATIGATLTSAVAIAVSPIPIIAVILMLMSPRSTRLGSAFGLGWFVGIVAVTAVVTLLSDSVPEQASGSTPIVGGIQITLGVALLLLGVRQWRSRPEPGETPELPGWMAKIDEMGVPAAAGLGVALAAANPKNLLVAAAAGTVIGSAGLAVGQAVVAVAVFSVIAALTVVVPVLLAVVAPRRAAASLATVRTWLTANNATIMTVLFVVLGANVLGKGLGAF